MMLPFRKKTPKHRKGRKPCKHYKSYKATLRIDFNKRCGYCNDLDTNRIRSFVIDHFIPQNPDGWTHSIEPNNYYNLVYACSFCNGAKSNKWPTKNAKISNDGIIGFIIPTKAKYGKIFQRTVDGSVTHENDEVAKYIHKELQLWQPIHSLNWKFETILEQERVLEKLYKKIKDNDVKNEIDKLKTLRLEVVDEINKIYNS